MKYLLLFAIVFIFYPMRALAGPPFDTDDPEPTEYRNYEIYSGVTTHRDGAESTSELPFLEVNYGLMPNVQFSVHFSDDEITAPQGGGAYGFDDAEMGIKVRFAQESTHLPQISFYPQVTFATGAPGVTDGHGTLFLPLWAQKTVGKVTIFGGGGYQFDRSAQAGGDWQAGIAATYQPDANDTVGLEATRTTPNGSYEQSDLGVGYIRTLGAHALLASVGRSYGPQPHYRGYIAYGWFLGPVRQK